MRTIKQLRELIAERADDEVIFCAFFDKSDADEWAEETMETTPLTDNEWGGIVNSMNNDDGLWHEMVQCWNHYLEQTINGRKGNEQHSA